MAQANKGNQGQDQDKAANPGRDSGNEARKGGSQSPGQQRTTGQGAQQQPDERSRPGSSGPGREESTGSPKSPRDEHGRQSTEEGKKTDAIEEERGYQQNPANDETKSNPDRAW